MRTYCSLVVRSDTDHQLETTVQRILGLSCGEFVDNKTPERLAQVARLIKILGKQEYSPPRYIWSLCSKNVIDSVDVETHISWLLNQVSPGRSIHEVTDHGGHAFITCFWAGNGRGGGPILPSGLVRAVADHGIELQFDFYVEDNNWPASGD